MRLRREVLVVAILCMGFALWAMPPVYAVGLEITGTVRDAAGNPVADAQVSDGFRTTTSDAFGRYTLTEPSHGTWDVTASKLHYIQQTKSVYTLTNLSDVDFALKFLINEAVPSYVTTKPSDVNLEATSIAPSTMTVTATIGATTVDLSYSGVSGSLNRWTGTYSVAADAAEGSYTANFVGKISGNVVTNQPAKSFRIDSIKPSLWAFEPGDNGNCLAPCEDLRAVVHDAGSGIDPSSASVTLRTGSSTVFGPEGLEILFNTAQYAGLKSSDHPLSAGDYTVDLTVPDKAGNALQLTYSFRVMTVTIPTTVARLRTTDATVSQITEGVLATFSDVGIDIDTYDVSLSSNKHAGYGFVNQRVSFATATVTYTDSNGGQATEFARLLPSPQVDAFAARVLQQPIVGFAESASLTNLTVPKTAATAGKLEVILPTGTVSARLNMTPVTTDSIDGYPKLASGIVAARPCPVQGACPSPLPLGSLDPLPLFTSRATAAAVTKLQARALQMATLKHEELVAQGKALPGMLPDNFTQYFARKCTKNLSNEKTCDEVIGSPSLPNQNGYCPPKTMCYPPNSTPGLLLTAADFELKCADELSCASPESTITASGQTSYYDCPAPDANGTSQCTEDHYNDFSGFRWLELHPDTNFNCQGPTDPNSGRKYCEHLWFFSGWGDTSRTDGDDVDGFQAGYSPPTNQQLYYIPQTAGAFVDTLPYTTFPYCQSGVGYNYTSSLDTWGSNATALSFEFALARYGPNGEYGQCIYTNSGGQIDSQYWIKVPGSVTSSTGVDQSNYQMRYSAVYRDGCSWQFTGLSVGLPPNVAANFEEVCDEPVYSDNYQLYWYYEY